MSDQTANRGRETQYFPIAAGEQRWAALVSYNGAHYCGFQRQKHSPSVQQNIEQALSSVANQPVLTTCAGRTDSGVHATGQVVHWDSAAPRTARNWLAGANRMLADDIALGWVVAVDERFHARFSAYSRTYRYCLLAAPTRPAVLAEGITWVRGELDITAMRAALPALLGEQDFSAVRGAGCQSHSPYREVQAATLSEHGQLLVLEITANAFLLHMVRNIVGALLWIGSGKQPPGWLAELLAGRDRRASAPTASGRGLYLVEVGYPVELGLPAVVRGPAWLPAQLD
jgi:tRNA pseudouridine38-40 synthase